MGYKVVISFLILIFSFNMLYAEEKDMVSFDIKVKNIPNDSGNIMIAVCSNIDEFDEKKQCKYGFSLPAKKGEVNSRLNVLRGAYVIMVYHDKNGNGKLDKSFVGRPKESYGFSNNKFGAFGSKPKFKDAVVMLEEGKSIEISLRN